MLQINKLTLTDFGAFSGTREFEFNDGLNVIQAPNGSGKSTILQAIEMLLTNSYEGSFEEYINNNASSFKATLNFSKNGIDFIISLSCKKGKNAVLSERILYDGSGNELASGEEAILYLSTILDPTLTRYSLIAKQKSIDNIVTCKDSERLDLFRKFKNLNFESYINSHLMPLIEVVKQELVQVEKEIYRLENSTYDIKDTLSLPFSKEVYLEKKLQLQEIIKKNETLSMRKKEYNDKKTSLENIINEISKSESIIKDKENKKKEDDSYLQLLKEESYLTEAYDTIELEYKEKAIIISSYIDNKTKEHKIEKIKFIEDKAILERSIQELTKTLETKKISKVSKFDDGRIKELEKAIAKYEQELVTVEDNIRLLAQGICPTCGNECNHKLGEWEDKKNNILSKKEESENLLSKELSSKAEYDSEIKKNQDTKEERLAIQSNLDSSSLKLNSLVSLMVEKENSFNKILENKKQELQNIEASLEKEKNQAKLSLEKDINIKESIIKELEKDIGNYTEGLINLQTTKEGLESWIMRNPIREDEVEVDTASIELEIKRYEDIEISNQLIEKENGRLTKLKKEDEKKLEKENKNKQDLVVKQKEYEQARAILLKDFPNYVIEQSIENIEFNMNQFISDVYYKSLNVSLKPTKTSIKLEYGQGERKLPAHRLSGAESKLVSLAFINNFNKYIGLSCLFLDEPDAAMDVKRQEDMYEILLSMKEVYKQIVVITHSEKMLNYLTSNTEVCTLYIG